MAGWRFLLDENVDPKVARYLEKEGLSAEHVRGALGQGADDADDVLPYARERDSIVVTSDVSDFASLPDTVHVGVILLYDDTLSAYQVSSGLLELVETYSERSSFSGTEVLDEWV